ncbi:LysR family transcriptional regulator [Actibacterium sp. D379-3]
MDWRAIPSLSALRAFEATARTRSFSAAARELNVTHAAVAQHVRALEGDLGVTLVFREGRGLALTPEGAVLALGLNDGFTTIQAAVRDVAAARASEPLKITLTASFATYWLTPRIGSFWREHPDVALSLHPDDRVVDMRRDGFDLAIRHGNGNWPGHEVEYLIGAQLVVVGSPALLKGHKHETLADLAKLPWVMEAEWREHWGWLRRIGLNPEAMQVHKMPTMEMASGAAEEGHGLHVRTLATAERAIRDGRLRVVYSQPEEDMAYYLVTRPGPQKPALRTFVRWLRSSI